MISVIVPVYNCENVLHYCIDSILNQTYKDFELILVDDGSTDNVNEDYLESLIRTKNKYPESGNIWCCFTTVNSYGGNPQNSNCIKSDKDCVEFDRSQIMTLHEKWLDAGPVCKLYSKEVIVKNLIRFNESISLGEDLIFNFDYIDKTNGQIIVKNASLYNYVQMSDESLSTKYYPDLFDIYKHNNSMMWDYIVRWGCDDEQKQMFYNSCFYLYERVLANTYHKDSDCKHKVRYNTRILKSEEFTKSLYHSNCFIHPAYRFAYKHQSYFMVRALDIILKIKKAK